MNTASPNASTTSPSSSLVLNLRKELGQHAPFSTMAPAHVDRFVAQATLHYYAPGEVLLGPQSGPVRHLLYIKQGSVTGRRGLAGDAGGFAYEAGDLFPIGAALASRAVTSTYTAETDTFCLLLPLPARIAGSVVGQSDKITLHGIFRRLLLLPVGEGYKRARAEKFAMG
jgi:CBS domain-containing protein